MIITENYVLDGRNFTKTYSDAGRSVVRDGIAYDEANDPSEFGRTYVEGDPIETNAEELLNILMGNES